MDGKKVLLNLLAINQQAKFEGWYDDLMKQSLEYAIVCVAEKEGIDLNEIIERG